MNYLVKWPLRDVFALLVYVQEDEFKYCYTDKPDFVGHIGNLSHFVSAASRDNNAIVIPTTATTMREVYSLYPELFI